MKLYELTDSMSRVMESLVESDGEITPEVEADLLSLEGEFDAKVESIALLVKEFEANAEAAKVEKDRLAKLQHSRENSAKRLKDYIRKQMEAIGKTHVKTDRIVVSIQKCGGSLPCECVVDPNTLPLRFKRITVEPDRKAALEAYEQTGMVPDGFRVGERGTYVRLR